MTAMAGWFAATIVLIYSIWATMQWRTKARESVRLSEDRSDSFRDLLETNATQRRQIESLTVGPLEEHDGA